MARKIWVTVVEEDGFLIALNGEGEELGRYRRTPPANEAKDENFSEELVTDAAGLFRSAIKAEIKRQGHANSRF